MSVNLSEHVASFSTIWEGGYFEGNPLNPVGQNSCGFLGYVSVLNAVYHGCIRPYVNADSQVLEIGCGRGAWTRCLLPAKEIWCLDALSAENNRFWQYLGSEARDKVTYLQVSDFSCRDLPDNHFDLLFSYGAFCHILKDGQFAYYRNLWPKLKSGANAFVMFGDFDKLNRAMREIHRYRLIPTRGIDFRNAVRGRIAYWKRAFFGEGRDLKQERPQGTVPGEWYHVSVEETAAYLRELGYEVVCPDLRISHRDPIVHFRKP